MAIIGIAYPFNRGTTALPAQSTGVNVIEDNIVRIMETRRGSRVMRRNLGSDVYDFCFENTGAALAARIDNEIRRAVRLGEPRATILRTQVDEKEVNGGVQIIITVEYEAQGVINAVQINGPMVTTP